MGQTLQSNSSSSNSHAKFGQKGQTRAQVALFCQQPQPSSQQAGILTHFILGNMSFL